MKYKNRVMQTTTTTGTGALTLGSPMSGYNTFAAAFTPDGQVTPADQFYYCIDAGASFEIGQGHITTTGTLSRDVLVESSTGALLNLAAGDKKVFATIPAQRANDFMWDKLSGLQVTTACDTVVPVSVAAGDTTVVLDLSKGRVFSLAIAGYGRDLAVSFSNLPLISSALQTVYVFAKCTTGPGPVTLTMPTSWVWSGGGLPGPVQVTNTTAAMMGMTMDGGIRWMGSLLGRGW